LQQLALLIEQAQAEVVCATWLAISRRLPCSSAALASASSAAARLARTGDRRGRFHN
jgi:hypothetical protein